MPRIPRFGKSADATQPPTSADPAAAPEHDDHSPTAVMPVADPTPAPGGDTDAPAAAPPPSGEAAPAGADPAPQQSLGFAERARARRRLRFLRRARELGYRDLGGLVFDLHRYNRERNDLVAAKVHTLSVMDQELHALETLLKQRQTVTVLHEPGIVACPRCAAIHGTEINYCPNCGLPTGGRPDMPMAVPGGAASAAPGPGGAETGAGTATPGPESTAAGTETAAPGSESTAPGTETAAPAPEPAAPGSEAAAPGPEAAAPGPDTAAPGEAPHEMPQPGADVAGAADAPAATPEPPAATEPDPANGEIAAKAPVRAGWPGRSPHPGASAAAGDDR
jgi:hypothetical protein